MCVSKAETTGNGTQVGMIVVGNNSKQLHRKTGTIACDVVA